MEKQFIFNGKELKLSKNSFKPKRVRSMPFIKAYNEFEAKHISDLQSQLNTFIFSNKKVKGYIVSANESGDQTELNKSIAELLIENPDYVLKAKELQAAKDYAKELFLTSDLKGEPDDSNAKLLCEIMFENHQNVNHNPQTEKDYDEYLKFIYEVWDVFFSKFSK